MSSCGATNANVRARLAEVERERDAMRAVLSELSGLRKALTHLAADPLWALG